MDGHGKKMNEESREHLSCLMDGEISRETSRFLVRRLGANEKLRMTWARYHLVRDCLRYQEGNLAGNDFTHRVQTALADDVPGNTRRRFTASWLKPVAGAAIAASVALMAIVTVGPGQGPVNGPASELAGSPQAETFVSPNSGLGPNLRLNSQQASTKGGMSSGNDRLNSYLLRHYQVTGSTGGKGFVTFVPIVVTPDTARAEADREKTGGEDNPENGNETSQK